MSNIQEIEPESLKTLLSNQVQYYNIYNADVAIPQHYAIDYYINNPKDTINKLQKLSISYCDIECYNNYKEFGSIKEAINPINAITEYNTITKTYSAMLILTEVNFQLFGINPSGSNFEEIKQQVNKQLIDELIKTKYFNSDDKLDLYLFNNDSDLLCFYWNLIHNNDPAILAGFNSDKFDYPYIYFRLCNIFDSNKANQIVSKINKVNVVGEFVNIGEFGYADILHLFKPRDEGGLSYGKKLSQYSLDYMSNKYLNLPKYDFHSEGYTSIDQLYDQNPIKFILYNIADNVLNVRLAESFDHINRYNDIRRLTKTTYSFGIGGISKLYDTFILHGLAKQGKYARFGISQEKTKIIKKNKLDNIPTTIYKKNKLIATDITSTIYRNTVSKYVGAYVKKPHPAIILDGLSLDLDATSLYPAMTTQYNISFDTFIGLVINPPIYTTLNILNQLCGNTNNLPESLPIKIAEMIQKHVINSQYANKKNAFRNYYYIILYLYSEVMKSKIPFNNICMPKTDNEIRILKLYLMPLLDVINTIHISSNKEYNQFMYDYYFMTKEELNVKYNNINIWLIINPYETNSQLVSLPLNQAIQHIQKYVSTISGSLFIPHDQKTGMFYDIITMLWDLRSQAKETRNTFELRSNNYKFYNKLQTTFKVVNNSGYGVFGLSSFRWSSHHLAGAITSSGRLVNKIAQEISEQCLTAKYGTYPKN